MSISIKVIHKGKPLNTHILDIKRLHLLTEQNLKTIAIATKDNMISIIDQNSKSPASSNGLRQNLDVHKTTRGYGIGRITDLPSWWKITNWGHSGYNIFPKNAKALRFKDKNGKIIYRKAVYNKPRTAINFLERGINYLRTLLIAKKTTK